MTTTIVQPNQLLLHSYTEDAYLAYAMASVKDRALPKVHDGLKPVQRRILYAMKSMGLTPDAKPVKSARIVGDVLGKLHPHGDSSVYDAMVRMAQPFTLRYPLVHGQGNFGSRDGDTAAAMRYTEARLGPVARLLLEELGQGTVDFIPNYDGTFEQPEVLPARLPILLLNGTKGIAVGMASNIPPHNLREVGAAATLCVERDDVTLEDVLAVMPGPDFPDGAQITSTAQEISRAYQTGRGSIRVRARWKKEELARGMWQIVVNELPYQVSPKTILEQVHDICNPRTPDGKKSLSPQQLALQTAALKLLESVKDESSDKSPIRIIITPKSSKTDVDALMQFLLANTSLEENFSLNCTMIGLDGSPRTKTVLELLKEWSQFRISTVRRRTQWELDQALKRAHILEGRLKVFNNIERVVKIIQESDDPSLTLKNELGLSEVQVADVLEMRLRQLNRLEDKKLQDELTSLSQTAERLGKILESEVLLRKLVVKEISQAVDAYGDDRRTLIQAEARSASSGRMASLPVDSSPVTIILSKYLWVRVRQGHDVDPGSLSYKPDDEGWQIVHAKMNQVLVLLDQNGRVFNINVRDIPATRGDGVPLSSLADLSGVALAGAFAGEPTDEFVFASTEGYGFRAPLSSCMTKLKAGKAFVDVANGEKALSPSRFKDDWLGCRSTNGRTLVFRSNEIPVRASGGKGVQLQALDEGAALEELVVADGGHLTFKKKDTEVTLEGDALSAFVQKRARKGKPL